MLSSRILSKHGIESGPVENGRLVIRMDGQPVGRIEPGGMRCVAPGDLLTENASKANVTLPNGGQITVADKDSNTTTIEVPSTGGNVGVKDDGTVTVPGRSTVTPPGGGDPITVPEGGGTVSGDGQVDNNITVSTVGVTPATTSVKKGKTQQFAATVTGTNNPAQTVKWTLASYTESTSSINADGLLTVGSGETASTITVKATSTFDTTKSGTATVTVTTPSGGGSTGGGSTDNDDSTTVTPSKPTTDNPTPPTIGTVSFTTYTVQKDDSFWSITWKYRCNVFELARINDKSIFSLIHPGDVLKVPEK